MLTERGCTVSSVDEYTAARLISISGPRDRLICRGSKLTREFNRASSVVIVVP
jgi:hypothetical protein